LSHEIFKHINWLQNRDIFKISKILYLVANQYVFKNLLHDKWNISLIRLKNNDRSAYISLSHAIRANTQVSSPTFADQHVMRDQLASPVHEYIKFLFVSHAWWSISHKKNTYKPERDPNIADVSCCRESDRRIFNVSMFFRFPRYDYARTGNTRLLCLHVKEKQKDQNLNK